MDAAVSTFPFYKRIAQKLEAGRFDTLFMNDSVGIPELDRSILERNTQAMRWDPFTLLPALAVVTERIGLTATASTSSNELYTLAQRLLFAEAAGQPIIPAIGAKTPDARARAEASAWLSFLPLWDRIIREEPDVLR